VPHVKNREERLIG